MELVELGGGSVAILQKAHSTFENKRYQWSLELCDALIEINEESREAKVRIGLCSLNVSQFMLNATMLMLQTTECE